MSSTYSEPTVLWRVTRGGQTAHATFLPGIPQNTLVWFVGETLERVENYEDWDAALMRAELVRLDLLNDGWSEIEC
ncbi:MAG: hypothetical protein HY654_02035 [Acidobacteria bacterium]|nr:hypothetical protein [Acidobacteriota bacterium]